MTMKKIMSDLDTSTDLVYFFHQVSERGTMVSTALNTNAGTKQTYFRLNLCNQERGWNDPPVFDFKDTSTLQASPRKHVLNKRVAYPAMTGSSTQHDNQMGTGTLLDPASGPPKTGITILPPTSSSEAPSLVPLIVPSLSPPATQTTPPVLSNSSTKTEDLTMSSTLEEVLQRLCISSDEELLDCVVSTLNEGLEQVKTNLSVRAAEDVKKKLTTLTENWRDEKLSLPVRCRMGNISEALKKRKYQDAWNIHQTLIVDYTSEVNLWLVGVKRVIHELLQNSKEQEISSEGNEESPSYPTKEEDEQVKEPANEHTVISESTNQNQESSVDSKPLETESTSNELIKESKADTETL